ncbi:MAG: hypothetical protein WKG00_01685 [Polyangiaceae bacterium]
MKRTFFGPSGAVWLQVAAVGVATACVAVAAPSCGGDVVVDGNTSSSGSGQGGASNSSGTPSGPGPGPVAQSAVVGSGPSVASSGVGPSGPASSVGPGPGQTAVSTGMGPCVTCSEFISGFEGPLCPQSQPVFDALLSCVCSFCSFQCGATCGNGGENGPQCDQCVEVTIQDACSSQFSQCADDT